MTEIMETEVMETGAMVSDRPEVIEFGQQVRDRRKAERLSQGELAQRVGISRNYLSQIERGESTNLSWNVRSKLCSLLGIQDQGEAQVPQLPGSLQAFADRVQLPPDDLQMLANLKYRGQQPDTPEKWEVLYNVIKVTMGKG